MSYDLGKKFYKYIMEGGKNMKLGKRRYSMNSIAVARGCSCYTMCTCKNRQSLKSYYNIKTTITEYSSAEGI